MEKIVKLSEVQVELLKIRISSALFEAQRGLAEEKNYGNPKWIAAYQKNVEAYEDLLSQLK